RLARGGLRVRSRRQRAGHARRRRAQDRPHRGAGRVQGERPGLKVIVVGLGVQGRKRREAAGAEFVAPADPVTPAAHSKRLGKVPQADYEAALVCTPEEPKAEVLGCLLGHGKHVLVEKPLWTAEDADLAKLEVTARNKGAVCYTAYNHRFEPHYVRM